jgi:nucleotide-binding universal stress UspA family protein
MLVPLDGSEMAELVLPHATELAERLGLELILLHVCLPTEQEFAYMHSKYIELMAEKVGYQLREIQEKAGTQQGGQEVRAHGELILGYPGEEIIRYIEKNDIDIILMASHGRSGIRRWTTGGVANQVLRASKVPVWLIPVRFLEMNIHDKWPTRRVLVPLDGSKLAESVLPHIEELAKQQGIGLVDVVLLQVCDTPDIPTDYTQVYLDWTKFKDEHMVYCRLAAKRYLDAVGKRLEGAGLRVHAEVLVGKASLKIIDYTNQNSVNLIVMSTYGLSGPGGWPWGSVVDRVLQDAPTPVLLVRPQTKRRRIKSKKS